MIRKCGKCKKKVETSNLASSYICAKCKTKMGLIKPSIVRWRK